MNKLASSIAKGSFLISISSTINKLLAILFVLLVLWYVPDNIGAFSIAMALIGIITLVPSLGIPPSLTRFIAYYTGRKEIHKIWPTYKNLTLLMFIIALATSLIFYFSAGRISDFYNNSNLSDILMLIIIASPFILIHPANIAYLKGLRKFKAVAVLSLFFMIVQVIALLYFIFYADEPTAYNAILSKVLSYLLVIILEFIFILYFSTDFIKKANRKITWKDYKEIFSYGIPLYLSSYGSYLANWTDTLVLGHYVEDACLAGYYTMSMIARNVGYFVSMILSTVLNPTITYLIGKGDDENAVKVSTHATKWYLLLSTPLLLAILIFPKQIISIVLPNSNYINYYYLLYALAPSFYMITLSGAYRNLLWAKGRTDVFMKVSGIIVIPNIILNVIFIPLFGPIGAAVATAISFVSAESLYIMEGRRYGVRYHKDSIKIIMINVILGLLLFAANFMFNLNMIEMVGLAGMFAVLYITMLYLSKIITINDIHLIIHKQQ